VRTIFVLTVVLLDLVLQVHFRTVGWGLANGGISWGMGQGWGWVIALVTFLIFLLVYNFSRSRPGMILILLGAAGNLLSRLIWGSVWDYVCLPLLPFCFNLCDVLISLGVVSYILGDNGN
jgi:lipoprotein signal peptidase